MPALPNVEGPPPGNWTLSIRCYVTKGRERVPLFGNSLQFQPELPQAFPKLDQETVFLSQMLKPEYIVVGVGCGARCWKSSSSFAGACMSGLW
ncbi:MAG: hypothetical protein ABJC09_15460 [Terriglobia bacterium]